MRSSLSSLVRSLVSLRGFRLTEVAVGVPVSDGSRLSERVATCEDWIIVSAAKLVKQFRSPLKFEKLS